MHAASTTLLVASKMSAPDDGVQNPFPWWASGRLGAHKRIPMLSPTRLSTEVPPPGSKRKHVLCYVCRGAPNATAMTAAPFMAADEQRETAHSYPHLRPGFPYPPISAHLVLKALIGEVWYPSVRTVGMLLQSMGHWMLLHSFDTTPPYRSCSVLNAPCRPTLALQN